MSNRLIFASKNPCHGRLTLRVVSIVESVLHEPFALADVWLRCAVAVEKAARRESEGADDT